MSIQRNVTLSADFTRSTFKGWAYYAIAHYFAPFFALWSMITGKVVEFGVTETEVGPEEVILPDSQPE